MVKVFGKPPGEPWHQFPSETTRAEHGVFFDGHDVSLGLRHGTQH